MIPAFLLTYIAFASNEAAMKDLFMPSCACFGLDLNVITPRQVLQRCHVRKSASPATFLATWVAEERNWTLCRLRC